MESGSLSDGRAAGMVPQFDPTAPSSVSASRKSGRAASSGGIARSLPEAAMSRGRAAPARWRASSPIRTLAQVLPALR